MMATDKERAKFKDALQKLLNETNFKNFDVFIMVKEQDTGEILMTGTLCMVCASDEIQEFIEDNGIKHFYSDDESTH